MNKEDQLKNILEIDFTKLTPSSFYKSELFLLSDDEFNQLRNHLCISDYQMSENNYDTINIGNKIFKNSK